MGGVLLLQAVTPLHAGVGRSEAAHVDLLVQRDEFGLPAIWASSLKGALKSHAKMKKDPLVHCVFGRDAVGQAPEGISGVTLFDARLLLIPARSLRGVWIYVTTPHMLRAFIVYLESLVPLGVEGAKTLLDVAKKALDISRDAPVVSSQSYLWDGSLVINELAIKQAKVNGDLAKFTEQLAKHLSLPKTDLAVVGDDIAKTLVDRSMLIQYRVRLTERKTVAEGALWSEEYLPQFSVLHSAVVCRAAKCREGNEERQLKAEEVCVKFRELAAGGGRGYVWVGGKETIGRGLVEVALV
ncbi:CRISPR-associated RAMP protein, Cmr4 family [Pyrobaculum neutrophilum V24Sta]|uniref:CRISPR-associated RAMP protein, Cmr4 family n=1 Tax=Pyrobaculum neutrophilum (strain DSM 2338 / JCM 9278 / NBRC 100436 / V24Sta) TaxID=444157 RepID=B1YCJ3_PYRNV|nr:CRISPR-associated RAMP protein, Cmr4 family [Pyrobaculum neutrophilum V24Sta]